MFGLGLMGIDVSEEWGGQGGSFFQSIVAIEEIAKVDPAASVIVDVQNTLVKRDWALGHGRAEEAVFVAARDGNGGRL